MKKLFIIFPALFLFAILLKIVAYPFSSLLILISFFGFAIIFLIKMRKRNNNDYAQNIQFGFLIFILITSFIFKLQYWQGYIYILTILVIQAIVLLVFMLLKRNKFQVLIKNLLTIKFSIIFPIIALIGIVIPYSKLIYFNEFFITSELRFKENKCGSYARYFGELEKEKRYLILEEEIKKVTPEDCDFLAENWDLIHNRIEDFKLEEKHKNGTSKRDSNWSWITDLNNKNGRWVKYGKGNSSHKDYKFQLFFDNGNLCQKGTIKNGDFIDTIYDYDLNGQLVSITICNGKNNDVKYYKQGKIETYYNNGKLNTIGFVVDSVLYGNWKSFNMDGIINCEGNRNSYKGTGWVKYYYENGIPKDSGYFYNEKQHGICKSWYKNGQIESMIEYSHGKINGAFKRWYQNGNLEEFVYYKNDKLHGSFTIFYENSNIYENKYFKNGFIEGEYRAFYPNGKLVISGNYKNSVMDGKWNYYTINGDIYRTDILSNGNTLSSKFVKELTKEEENHIAEFCNYSKHN